MSKPKQFSIDIKVNGVKMASVAGHDEDFVLSEAARYVAQYAEEGEVSLKTENVDLRKVIRLASNPNHA